MGDDKKRECTTLCRSCEVWPFSSSSVVWAVVSGLGLELWSLAVRV